MIMRILYTFMQGKDDVLVREKHRIYKETLYASGLCRL